MMKQLQAQALYVISPNYCQFCEFSELGAVQKLESEVEKAWKTPPETQRKSVQTLSA